MHGPGHKLSMLHFTACECSMNGSNHLQEADRRPICLCPECMAKVCWATKTDPAWRYRGLAWFCGTHGFTEEKALFDRSIKALE